MPRIHVVPRTNGWAVRSEGATRAFRIFPTKDEALRAALSHGRATRNSVVVHGRDNRIQKIITPRQMDEGGNCFLTSACVEFFKLSDNCYQLTTLRHFRDSILIKSKKGKSIIAEYNQIAPLIVSHLWRDKAKENIFNYLFTEINITCKSLEKRNYKKAIEIYKRAVTLLALRYKIV